MRVLFMESHPMWIHGLPNGFRDAGHQVKVSGPLTEHKIIRLLFEFRPELIVTMGWTREHKQENLVWIRKLARACRIPRIYWATEDPTHTETFSLPLMEKLQPDFVFTICPARVEYYKRKGIKAAHMDFGYHSKVHYPVEPHHLYTVSIAIVANAYPTVLAKYPRHYRHESLNTLIRPILEKNLLIDYWGRDWNKMDPILQRPIPQERIHGYLHYTQAHKVYSSAKIVIGLQNHQTQVTQRTYEILGSGGFLLTSDTPEIRRLFKPDQDLVVSSSPEDTLRLVRYYLKHPEDRQRIRQQGRLSVANHTYKHRAEYMVDVLKKEGIL